MLLLLLLLLLQHNSQLQLPHKRPQQAPAALLMQQQRQFLLLLLQVVLPFLVWLERRLEGAEVKEAANHRRQLLSCELVQLSIHLNRIRNSNSSNNNGMASGSAPGCRCSRKTAAAAAHHRIRLETARRQLHYPCHSPAATAAAAAADETLPWLPSPRLPERCSAGQGDYRSPVAAAVVVAVAVAAVAAAAALHAADARAAKAGKAPRVRGPHRQGVGAPTSQVTLGGPLHDSAAQQNAAETREDGCRRRSAASHRQRNSSS